MSCIGKPKCSLDNLNDPSFYAQPRPSVCTNDNTNVFVQFSCELPPELQQQRRLEGLVIACLGVFIALFFLVYVDYVKSVAKNTFVEWDVKTITAGDYTTEYDIPKAQFDNFVNQVYDPNCGLSKAAAFRNYLKAELEKRLSEFPNLGFEEDEQEIQIAQIALAFDNAQLINMLRARGNFIKMQKFDEMRKMDAKIDEYRSQNAAKVNRPVSAFITFESEEGLNRCVRYNEIIKNDETLLNKGYDKLLGQPLNFENASEPTDIIWENRHFTTFQRLRQTIVVVLIIAILLLISFMIIFVCSKTSTKVLQKYPPVSCGEFYEKYPDLKTYAIGEYFKNRNSDGVEKSKTSYLGYLQCFCAQQKKDIGSKVSS